MQSQGNVGWNVQNDFNFDSYLMHEIELTLFKYFNDASGFLLSKALESLHILENLCDYGVYVHPHRDDDFDLLFYE